MKFVFISLKKKLYVDLIDSRKKRCGHGSIKQISSLTIKKLYVDLLFSGVDLCVVTFLLGVRDATCSMFFEV
jgi:hypothetical protein